MTNTYLEGSLVRVATYEGTTFAPMGGFRDVNGVFTDPLSVVLKYKAGSAPLVTVAYPSPPITRDAAGLYHADLDTTGFGACTVTYEWNGTGTVQAIAQGDFNVQAAPF